MAENNEEQRIKLTIDTNAKQAAGDVNKLGVSIDNTTDSTNENNEAVKKGGSEYKNFKTQLREANQELQKSIQLYGETSAETVKAAKAVANLKDEMGFAKDLADKFNPDQKMKALGAATAVAGTGLTGVTAGMALFGDQSKDTQAQLLKVQAAMAFSDALSNLSNIGDQFAILKTTIKDTWTTLTTAKVVDTAATGVNTSAVVANTGAVVAETAAVGGSTVATTAATVATNLWNASLAIVLAPVTLIVAAVAGLVLGIGYLTGAFGDFNGAQLKAEIATKKFNTAIDSQTKFFEKHNAEVIQRNKNIYDLAKASGKSSAELQVLATSLLEVEIAQKRMNAVNLRAISIEAQRALSLDSSNEALQKAADKANIAFIEGNKIYNESLGARKQLAISHNIEIKQAQTDAAEKERERQKEEHEKTRQAKKDANDKLLADQKAAIKKEADEKLAIEMKSAQDAINIVDELKKNIESPAQKEQREYEEKKLVLEANNLSTEELTIQHIDKLTEIQKTAYEKAATDKKTEDEKKASEQKLIDDAVIQQKKELEGSKVRVADAAVGFLSQIAGKNKALQKAAIIVESAVGIGKTLISNASGNAAAAAVAAPLLVNPITAVPAAAALAAATLNNNIATGIGVAGNIAATAKALQALGGGSAPSAGNISGGVRGSAAPTVAFNNTSENQIGQSLAKSQIEQPPIKVYVAESDISKAQNSVKVLVNKNTI
jgi:hypothetical protein